MTRSGKWCLTLLFCLLAALHQDFWFWSAARPLVFGFLPIGLFYHGCYSLAAGGAMWLLVRLAWPAHLEAESRSGHGREDS